MDELLKFSQIPNDYTQFAPCKEFWDRKTLKQNM
jgi:hypothetical protein